MSTPERPGEQEPEWKRKARLARIFGDALPETTADERDEPSGDDPAASGNEARLRRDVPPHHGS